MCTHMHKFLASLCLYGRHMFASNVNESPRLTPSKPPLLITVMNWWMGVRGAHLSADGCYTDPTQPTHPQAKIAQSEGLKIIKVRTTNQKL